MVYIYTRFSNRSGFLSTAYKKHEDIKNGHKVSVSVMLRAGSSHLSFFHHGGMGRETTTLYKMLEDMLASKQQKPYPVVIS